MSDFQWLEGGITAVPGILASGIASGIKPSGKKDLALVYSSAPARAAAVFTSNQVKGAPVVVSQEHVRGRKAQAIVASSGCANVCTGEPGIRDAREMTRIVGDLLHVPAQHVLVAATGVIGQPLPMDRIRAALPKLVKALSPQGGRSAAEAIMTTDTVPKAASARVKLSTGTATVTGIAKGAGMIRPDMATMLGFVATDAKVGRADLQRVARRAADASFNAITVDGDTSTNDAFVCVATGKGPAARSRGDLKSLAAAVNGVAQQLAQAIVRDGEGATKFVTVRVERGRSEAECRKAAYAIAHSPLVKTAFFAGDPNLGRILAAIGNAGIGGLDASKVDLYLDDVLVAKGGGRHAGYREEQGTAAMRKPEFTVCAHLNRGRASATVWTCDLSFDYVKINAEYRS
jgi:glutamate N-acetyltransferase/amino-acid N-acetyltransferase